MTQAPKPYGQLLLSLAALIFSIGYVGLRRVGMGGWRLCWPIRREPGFVFHCSRWRRSRRCVDATLAALRGCSGNDWILPILFLAGLAMGAASAWCDRRDIWTIGGGDTRFCGLATFLVGVVFRIAAMRTLGSRFSVWVTLQENHRLHTTGCYRMIRHPSYTGVLLALVGWALTFRSVVGVVIAIGMVALLVTRMEAEEVLLISEFGEEYLSYRRRTWRLAPYIY